MKRTLGLATAVALSLSVAGGAAMASPNPNANPNASKPRPVPEGRLADVQLLHFSDFHGHLQPNGEYGGAAYLSGLISQLRGQAADTSYTLNSGDNIGGSTFLSGLFQDEPTIEVLNAIGLDAAAVGNHELDEGKKEFARIINGGNHPELGQMGPEPYTGTKFPYLSANLVDSTTKKPLLPPYVIQKTRGVEVGIIGITTSDLPELVSPAGIAGITVLPEAETINRYAAELQRKGVQSIVVLMHEGGNANAYPSPITAGSTNGCDNLTGKIVDINKAVSPAVDVFLTGHTHRAFTCELPDPKGVNRTITGPGDWGRVLTEVNLRIDRQTKDVVRSRTSAVNHVVTTSGPADARVQSIVDRWQKGADVVAREVIGSAAEAITGDASGDRGVETAMGNLVADAILAGTSSDGAQISLMNIGGVRASLDAGDITYEEAYAVLPFGNRLVTLDMTGAQLEEVLNQQYNASRSRTMLALSVSEGFTYTWDASANRVVSGSMALNGQPIEAGTTYKVSTLNFLADGGDGFTAFTEASARVGGPEDLSAFISYIRANSPVASPGADRVTGL
ncbi:MAG: bifunctional UDP-sugar hydrolase/5'-nucleotidase [Mobilicoccus sp.]|nr:bifunctional UDP-sugar hydrolase/5'-nucleotidase [Mobilicoccus sp.]